MLHFKVFSNHCEIEIIKKKWNNKTVKSLNKYWDLKYLYLVSWCDDADSDSVKQKCVTAALVQAEESTD